MRRPYIVTVDRDAIDKGSDCPIRCEAPDGTVTHHRSLVLGERTSIKSGPPRRDGARVWIETDEVIPP